MVEQPSTQPTQNYSVAPIYSAAPEIIEQILDPAFVIERVRRNLKGQIQNPITKEWEQWGEPMMNENGLKEIVSLLDSYVNRNTLLSNLKEEEIYEMMRNFEKRLIDWLKVKHVDFGLDTKNLNIIKTRIVDMVFLALKQAQNRELLKALTQTYNVQEQRQDTQKKVGLGMRILGFGGK